MVLVSVDEMDLTVLEIAALEMEKSHPGQKAKHMWMIIGTIRHAFDVEEKGL